jgi:glc operon protein GlcG
LGPRDEAWRHWRDSSPIACKLHRSVDTQPCLWQVACAHGMQAGREGYLTRNQRATMFRVENFLVLAVLVGLFKGPSLAQELPTKRSLNLDTARQIASAAEKHARENQWKVCIAIVDDGGHLIYFQRMDGVQTGSVEVSQRKAQTAIAFKRPTKVFEEGVAGGRNALLGLPGAVPLEGGIPLTVDGEMVGAIGISGVTAQQDGMIAQAGVDALPAILRTKSN